MFRLSTAFGPVCSMWLSKHVVRCVEGRIHQPTTQSKFKSAAAVRRKRSRLHRLPRPRDEHAAFSSMSVDHDVMAVIMRAREAARMSGRPCTTTRETSNEDPRHARTFGEQQTCQKWLNVRTDLKVPVIKTEHLLCGAQSQALHLFSGHTSVCAREHCEFGMRHLSYKSSRCRFSIN